MNIILTGIARSGTTLACSLLNKLPQTIALHEPMNYLRLARMSFPEGYLDGISAFYSSQRKSLLESGTAFSKGCDGKVPDNPFGSTTRESGLRQSLCSNQVILFEKPLHADFRLVVKHPNFFTATLEVLQPRYPCYAIVRNPLGVLLSWHSVKANVNQGRIQAAEAFDEDLKRALSAEPDRLVRQLLILRWCYSRYATLLPGDHVIRYEEIVASGGRALKVIAPAAELLAEPLDSRNVNTLYDSKLVRVLAERLLDEESIYAEFYSRAEVEKLCAEWAKSGLK
jgi:hypothetical protein